MIKILLILILKRKLSVDCSLGCFYQYIIYSHREVLEESIDCNLELGHLKNMHRERVGCPFFKGKKGPP
jgi:hypothetical protein